MASKNAVFVKARHSRITVALLGNETMLGRNGAGLEKAAKI